MKRIHPTRPAARAELVNTGYASAFSSPGRPELWVRPDDHDRRAVRRRITGADVEWEIVAYPEPAVCSESELAALETRDGTALNGGLGIVPSLPDDGTWLG